MRKWLKSGSTASQNATVWDAIKAGTRVHVRMIFTGQNITLEDQDISLDSGLVVNDIFNGDTDIVFGKTVCKQINVRILNSNRLDGLSWTGEFLLQMWVEISTVEYTCDIGYFYGEQPKNVTTARYIDFTAYDAMKKFDIPADNFINGITYPIILSQMFSDLCSYVGVTPQIGDALSTKNRSFASAPVDMVGYSCRDILGWIAEACGCYAKIVAKQCVLIWFADNTAHSVTPTEEFKVESADLNPGLTWDEFDELTNAEQEAMTLNDIAGYKEAYAVDQMMVKQVDSDFTVNYPNSHGENIYAIVDNPFIIVSSWDDVVNYVKPLYDRLSAFGGYLPFNAECIGDPAVEAGDIITIDINGTTLTAPVFVKTMRWNGSLTDIYETTGQIPRSEYGTNANRQSVLNANSMKMFVRNQYYNRQSGIEITDIGVIIDGDKFVDIISNNERTRFDEKGITRTDSNNQKIVFGEYSEPDSDVTAAVMAGADSDDDGFVSIYTSPVDTDVYSAELILQCKKNTQGLYVKSLHVGGYSAYNMLGLPDSVFGYLYVSDLVGSKATANIDGVTYDGGACSLILPINNQTIDPRQSPVTSNFPVLDISYYPGYSPGLTFTSTLNGATLPINFGSSKLFFYSAEITWLKASSYVEAETVYYRYLVQNSSREIKHNINPLPSIGERLDQLKPVSFVYDDDRHEKTRYGLIYEDTQEVMPEICTDDESNKAISYIELVPALLKEIQDLRKRVAELERRD